MTLTETLELVALLVVLRPLLVTIYFTLVEEVEVVVERVVEDLVVPHLAQECIWEVLADRAA
jgi:hypothetical protein